MSKIECAQKWFILLVYTQYIYAISISCRGTSLRLFGVEYIIIKGTKGVPKNKVGTFIEKPNNTEIVSKE